jgi:tetratricopeptide (TPR) repeat protein
LSVSSFLRNGVDFALNGSPSKAEICFRRAFSLSSDGSTEKRNSLANLLKVLLEQGKEQEILEILESSADRLVFSLPPTPLLLGAEVALKRQRVALSMKLYDFLNSQYPNQKAVVLGFSSAMVRVGQFKQAESLLSEFQRNIGLNSEVLTNPAIIALEQGFIEEAESGYRQANALDSGKFVTNYNLAKFLQVHRGLEESLIYYNQCLAIVPTAFEAKIQKADVLVKLNKKAEAIAIYKELVYRSDLKLDHKNLAICQYLYVLLDEPSLQSDKDEADKLLVNIPLSNKFLSLMYDLPEERQREHGGIAIYKPASFVKQLQLVPIDDKVLHVLAHEIKTNPTLIANRAGKPTLGGEQTHEILVGSSSTISTIFARVKDVLVEYGSQLPNPIKLDTNKEYMVSGWAVSLQSGGRQLRHTHPEAIISAVLYIQIPEEIEQGGGGSGCLYFSKRRNDQKVDEIKIMPAPGKLVMFPSFFPHETINFAAKTDRICIACNLLELP